MTDPRRLRDQASDFERELLDAGQAEGPSHDVRRRAAVALGIAGSLALQTATAAVTAGSVEATPLAPTGSASD
jgi:hypothetical protein